MSENQTAKINNPLSQYFRQPKIYIKLPSNGQFYPDNALDRSSNGEYPVYPMTAKDELMFKTPDALLSGQSTVEIIKSCVPAILDPWAMPSIDLDAVLVAIRIATYGENMDLTANCPSCKAENVYEMDLPQFLDSIAHFQYQPNINWQNLVIHVRPYTYRELTKTALKAFEQQRIINVVNDDTVPDEEKLNRFNESFVKLTQLTVEIIADCVDKIDTPDSSVTDVAQIKEFVLNAPKELFDLIQSRITELKSQIEMQPQDAKCTSCNHEWKLDVTMDQSNFFGAK